MKNFILIIGIVTLSMIMFSCSMDTQSNADVFGIQIQNPAHIRIAEVKPGETFYVAAEIKVKESKIHPTDAVTLDISSIYGNEPGTDLVPMSDDGIRSDKTAGDKIYSCSYTLPYGNDEGINAGDYILAVIVKDKNNEVINDDNCTLRIKGLPPVIEFATINNKSYEKFSYNAENVEIDVSFKTKVSTYNGHHKGNNGFDEHAGGYVKVEIPPELYDGVLTEVSLYDDGQLTDEEAWDCEFNGSFKLKPVAKTGTFEVVFRVRNTAGVEVTKSLEVSVNTDYTYVSASAGNDETGDGSINSPFKTIQKAIDEAVFGVKILPGIYSGEGNVDINFGGKEIVVESTKGAKYTVIDCKGSETNLHRGFTFDSCESETTVLKGITIRNGYAADDVDEMTVSVGGGILCKSFSSPRLEDLVIEKCTAELGAGIACIDNSNPTIINSEIIDNTSIGSSAISGGAGVAAYLDSNPILKNCLIAGNTAEENGSGIYCIRSMATISNCTIADNTSGNFGGGIYINSNSIITINDSIIWDNEAAQGNEIYITVSANSIMMKNTCFDTSTNDVNDERDSIDTSMGGNINENPIFESGARGKYYLKFGSTKTPGSVSPCVDSGSVSVELLEFIRERTTSIQGFDDSGIVDMGYHYEK